MKFCERAKERGPLIRPIRNQYRVRLVVYKGITRKDAEEAAAILLALDSELKTLDNRKGGTYEYRR